MVGKKLALVDADTLVYQAAAVIQEAPLIVEHKISGRKKEFKNKTAWQEFLKSDKGRGYDDSDFNVVQEPRLREDVSHALHIIKNSVEAIANQDWCSDFHLFVGGEGNFRKQVATMKEYKSGRPPRPIAFQQCYDYLVNKYKDRVTICHGIEAEDGVAQAAWPKYLEAKKARDREIMDVVICRVDKDLRQSPGWHYDYGKKEGPFWITDTEAARHFWWQVLKGDPTDSIVGLQGIGEETKKKYGLRTSKGCGDASATKILEGANNEKEFAQRVVDAYKDFYGKKWEAPLIENGILLRMQRTEGEMFNAVEYVKSLGVEV